VLDSGAVVPGLQWQLQCCQTVHTRRASVHQAVKFVAALLRVARVTAGLVESSGRLTAKNRNQLHNPVLSNRVRATFFYVVLRPS